MAVTRRAWGRESWTLIGLDTEMPDSIVSSRRRPTSPPQLTRAPRRRSSVAMEILAFNHVRAAAVIIGSGTRLTLRVVVSATCMLAGGRTSLATDPEDPDAMDQAWLLEAVTRGPTSKEVACTAGAVPWHFAVGSNTVEVSEEQPGSIAASSWTRAMVETAVRGNGEWLASPRVRAHAFMWTTRGGEAMTLTHSRAHFDRPRGRLRLCWRGERPVTAHQLQSRLIVIADRADEPPPPQEVERRTDYFRTDLVLWRGETEDVEGESQPTEPGDMTLPVHTAPQMSPLPFFEKKQSAPPPDADKDRRDERPGFAQAPATMSASVLLQEPEDPETPSAPPLAAPSRAPSNNPEPAAKRPAPTPPNPPPVPPPPPAPIPSAASATQSAPSPLPSLPKPAVAPPASPTEPKPVVPSKVVPPQTPASAPQSVGQILAQKPSTPPPRITTSPSSAPPSATTLRGSPDPSRAGKDRFDAPSSGLGVVLSSSNAAADAQTRADSNAKQAVTTKAGSIELLWHHDDALDQLRRSIELRALLPKPRREEDEDERLQRRDILTVMEQGTTSEPRQITFQRSTDATRSRLVLARGFIEPELDEIAMLRAVAAASTPLRKLHARIDEAVAEAFRVLDEDHVEDAPAVAAQETSRLLETIQSVSREDLVSGVRSSATGTLVRARKYAFRELEGERVVRARLHDSASAPSTFHLTLYLPEDAAKHLPLFRLVPAVVLATVKPPLEEHEDLHALWSLALARDLDRTSADPRRPRPSAG